MRLARPVTLSLLLCLSLSLASGQWLETTIPLPAWLDLYPMKDTSHRLGFQIYLLVACGTRSGTRTQSPTGGTVQEIAPGIPPGIIWWFASGAAP